MNAEYKRLQDCDKGGPPYFYDVKNPPVYENGRLLEGFRYGEGTQDDKACRGGLYNFEVVAPSTNNSDNIGTSFFAIRCRNC